MKGKTHLAIELAVPNFFAIPLRQVDIESVPETGRVYFIYCDRVIAVAKRREE